MPAGKWTRGKELLIVLAGVNRLAVQHLACLGNTLLIFSPHVELSKSIDKSTRGLFGACCHGFVKQRTNLTDSDIRTHLANTASAAWCFVLTYLYLMHLIVWKNHLSFTNLQWRPVQSHNGWVRYEKTTRENIKRSRWTTSEERENLLHYRTVQWQSMYSNSFHGSISRKLTCNVMF